jgi:hypothetical protein
MGTFVMSDPKADGPLLDQANHLLLVERPAAPEPHVADFPQQLTERRS